MIAIFNKRDDILLNDKKSNIDIRGQIAMLEQLGEFIAAFATDFEKEEKSSFSKIYTSIQIEISNMASKCDASTQIERRKAAESDVKMMAHQFQKERVHSSERSFNQAKESYNHGNRSSTLIKTLIKYSAWKHRIGTHTHSSRAEEAEEKAKECIIAHSR